MDGAAEEASPESIQYRQAVATAKLDNRIRRMLIRAEDHVGQAAAVEHRLLIALEYVSAVRAVQQTDGRLCKPEVGLANRRQARGPD